MSSRAQGSPSVFINEIHYDNAGTDTGEFIEIAGPAGTDLSTYSLVRYNGATPANGVAYTSPVGPGLLSGIIPDEGGGFGVVHFAYPTDGLQNGSNDGVALVQGTTVIQFLSYEGTMVAGNGPAAGMTSTDIGVAEGATTPVGSSLQLTGTGSTYGQFTWTGPSPASPGAVNAGQTFSSGGGPTISIDDVSVVEGNSGTTTAQFTVTVSGAHGAVMFDIATADGTGASPATLADADYVQHSLVGQTIPASPSNSIYGFAVSVNGDTTFENDEDFHVLLSNVSGATVAKSTGVGTIDNDDAPPPVASDVVISQVYGGGGNAGATLTHDFIELFNRGTSTVSLAGWSVQYVSATGTGTWAVTPLGNSIAPGQYYLVQQAQGEGGTTPLPAPDATGTIGMAAGAGKVALRSTTAPLAGTCLDVKTSPGLRDLVGYGTTASCFEGSSRAPQLSNTTAAFRKRGGCFDSNDNDIDFSANGPAPRNSASPLKSCAFTPYSISQIQGDGAMTPHLGEDVSTTGIVTARKSNGFFIQTPDGGDDGNADTSEGLFVFTSSTPAVAVGDQVTARGTASEFFSLTQIESTLPGDVTVDLPGQPVPAAVVLTPAILDPDGAIDQLERFEGMRLHAASLTSVAPSNQFGEFHAVLSGAPRPVREPGIEAGLPVPPDPTSGLPDCCIPIWDRNPERVVVDTDGLAGMAAAHVTTNVVVTNVTGPLDFTFGEYKLLPEAALAPSANMSAVPVPDREADEFTVGGFNIENFANGATQRRKAALAIAQVMRYPDVIGHVEILNLAALQALADQVNQDAALAGVPDIDFQAYLIEAPNPGNTQEVGFLVNAARIQVGSVIQEGAAATFTNPNNSQQELLNDRPPLVLHAHVAIPGRTPKPIVVVVNHLRSFINVELVGGEGPRVRAKRTAQAEFLAGLLQTLQTDNPLTPVISIGDYNAYQFNDGYTDPLSVITGMPTPDDQIVVDQSPDLVDPDFANLTWTLPADQRYSFVFEGTPQALDHVVVNTVAADLVRRYAVARNNADFPESPEFTGDATRPERASDHDMPVAYFAFPPEANLSVSVTSPGAAVHAGTNVSYSVMVANAGPDAASNATVTIAGTSGLELVSIVAAPGWSCTLPAAGTSGDIVCTVASLAASSSAMFSVTQRVACSVADAATLAQAVSIAASTTEVDGEDNNATVSIAASNPPPVLTGATASTTQLWPPNHKMVDVGISYSASDACGAQVRLTVSSNEPVAGAGGGDMAPDWEIVNPHLVRLRAERAGNGNGRVYTVTITAVDAAGGSSQSVVTVSVPHDKGKP
jgi:predicted extracellular nuclease